jgi:hypothetical protein
MTLAKKISELEKALGNILPNNWEDKFETHEDLYELFQRSFDKAEDIAIRAIAILKEVESKIESK